MVLTNRPGITSGFVTLSAVILLSAGSAWGADRAREDIDGAAGTWPAVLSLRSQPAPQAAAETAAEMTREPYNIRETNWLGGDWGGARTEWQEQGIRMSFILTSSYAQNFRGGLNTHNAVAFSGDWRMNLTLDFDQMGLIPGAFFFIRGKSSWNNGVDADVGPLRPIHFVFGSGGDEEYYIDKWWYGQRLLEDRLEFRVGKLLTLSDLFDIPVYAKWPWDHFLNANLNRSPNLPHRKSLGAYMKVKLNDWAHLQMAALDADQTDGTLPADVENALHDEANFVGLWEFVVTPKIETAKGTLPGHYRLGWWYDGRSKQVIKADLDGAVAPRWRSDDVGWYLTFDQSVWKESDDPEDKQGIGAFFRYSFAHPEVNRINHFWSVGARYLGLVPGRDRDVLAFGIAQSIMSKTLRHELDSLADRETIYELYYAYQATPWCIITPDLQFITNPGGDKDARDALIGGIRVRIAF